MILAFAILILLCGCAVMPQPPLPQTAAMSAVHAAPLVRTPQAGMVVVTQSLAVSPAPQSLTLACDPNPDPNTCVAWWSSLDLTNWVFRGTGGGTNSFPRTNAMEFFRVSTVPLTP
jgi:hypothetical protein